MDFTCDIGIVCAALSSPAREMSAGEVAVTVPAIVVPSRIRTVACGPVADLFAQDATNNRVPRVAAKKMVRRMRLDVNADTPEALGAVRFIVTSNQATVIP
jgi:hypothetical protein